MKFTLACLASLLVVAANVSAETMTIKVNYYGVGKMANFEIDTTDKVLTLKEKIHDKFGVKTDEEWLFSEHGIFQDDQPLSKYQLKKNEEVALLVLPKTMKRPIRATKPAKVTIDIFNKTSKKTITMDVDLGETVLEMKKEIETKEKILVKYQFMIHVNQKLDNSKTLEDYGITDNEKLVLFDLTP